jgi:hypothetical protein
VLCPAVLHCRWRRDQARHPTLLIVSGRDPRSFGDDPRRGISPPWSPIRRLILDHTSHGLWTRGRRLPAESDRCGWSDQVCSGYSQEAEVSALSTQSRPPDAADRARAVAFQTEMVNPDDVNLRSSPGACPSGDRGPRREVSCRRAMTGHFPRCWAQPERRGRGGTEMCRYWMTQSSARENG